MADKIYEVTDIDFSDLILEASETDLKVIDVPESEVFPIEDFSEFTVRLVNSKGVAEIINFEEWKKKSKRV